MNATLESSQKAGRAVPNAPWPMVCIKDVVEINPRPAPLPDDTLVSFVPMKCVEEESGRFVSAGDKRVVEVRKGYTAFRDGDVIWAKVTPCMENGKAAVLTGLTNGVGYGSTEFFVLRPSAQLDSTYLLHFILQKSFRQRAAQHMTGAVGLRRVPKSFLEQQEIPLPPLDEQRRIVAEIEKQFTCLDAGVAALRRVQANLKRYRAAVLKAACEGRLVPTEAELARKENRTFETGEQLLQHILAERRKNWSGRGKYKEPTPPNVPIATTLPDGWTWVSPNQISAGWGHSLAIGPFGSNLKVADYTESGVPLVFVRNIRSDDFGSTKTVFVSAKKAAELKAHQISPGDILVTKMGEPPGDACLYPLSQPVAVITADCIKIALSPLLTETSFFVHAINSEIIRSQMRLITKGVAQQKVSLGRFCTIALPLPPFAEQKRIVAEVERRLSVIDKLASVAMANLNRATRLRQSILRQIFTQSD